MYDTQYLLKRAQALSQSQQISCLKENRILLLTCSNPQIEPRELGAQYTKQYEGSNVSAMPGIYVIRIYKKLGLSNIANRKALCTAAWQAGGQLAQVIRQGEHPIPWQKTLNHLPANQETARLLLLSLLHQADDLFCEELVTAVQELSRESAHVLLQELMHSEAVQTPPMKGIEQDSAALEQENQHLRCRLEHTQAKLDALQKTFQQQLAEQSANERIAFFSQLNSEPDGRLLDLLVLSQSGFAQLRKQGTPIPMEIRSAPILVRRMQDFLRNYGVVPMRELGERFSATARDLDNLHFVGKPFRNDKETKLVEITSTGWAIPEKDIIISLPEVCEVLDASNS